MNWLSARLVEHESFTPHVGRFVFHTERPLEFVPGQYATLAVADGKTRIERPYSVCSVPGSTELEFYCDFAPEVLAPIARKMELGAELTVKPAADGRLTADPSAQGHLFLATVTGGGPFISMIRHAAQSGGGAPMLLVHGASVSAELGTYRNELESLAAQHEWLTYVPTVSRPWLDPEWRGERGRVEDVFRKYSDRAGFQPGSCTAYACGNPDMIQKAKGVLKRSGFAAAGIRDEES